MSTPSFRANIVPDAATEELAVIDNKLLGLAAKDAEHSNEIRTTLLEAVGRIDIAPGEIKITLSVEQVAALLKVEPERVSEDLLSIKTKFRHRKRGVETKLIFGDNAAARDETLFRNIARAHRYFDMILAGQTFGEIAEKEGASKRRIQQLIELAFLAPDVVRNAFEGRQPTGLTSEWLARHSVPPIWQDQREMFQTL